MRLSLKFVFIFLFIASACNAGNLPLREGDIVFQSFPSLQSTAIQLATKSQYSHMGMILMHNGKLMVYEAVGPVKFTSIDSWIKRDENRHIVVKRLKNISFYWRGVFS
jgi:hypothetical protein